MNRKNPAEKRKKLEDLGLEELLIIMITKFDEHNRKDSPWMIAFYSVLAFLLILITIFLGFLNS